VEIEVRGVNIYYESVGQGRPLLMLHGGGLDHRHMADELEPLFVTFRPVPSRVHRPINRTSRWSRIKALLPSCGPGKVRRITLEC